ncbi:UPF0182 family membrane protein [Methanogenium organophilum]|uniref:UPF0182 protein OU421_08705 n=1 Tax=Methanogenium organophilum TaxID=2199 RepID=A0A9X9T7W0_METOG|nr:UPF0182 family protein [Methanogenium organophilum]WAI00507.1 UPF0182 family protein [Methanogenium organophilum]
MNRQRLIIAGIAILVFILVLFGLLGDWYWFVSIGYEDVFLSILFIRVVLFVIVTAVFFGFAYLNIRHAAGKASRMQGYSPDGFSLSVFFAGLLALFAGLSISGAWETVYKYLNQAPFGMTEPIFGLDVGFYVFSLPFYNLALNLCIALFILTILLSGLPYLAGLPVNILRNRVFYRSGGEGEGEGGIGYESSPSLKQTIQAFLPQLNALLFLTFAALALRLWLARFDLLFSETGAVVGAGYTAVHITLPVLTILAGVAFVIGIGFLINEKFERIEVITYGIAAFVAIAFIGIIAGAVVQGLIVEPNELNLEEQYLDYNIRFTLASYDLDTADEVLFPVAYNLSAADIQENNATIKNIRLWDWRPLKTTYEQLQLFRTYYDFNDVDVDRYHFDGTYKEVLVSAREMNIRGLQPQAQTWVNTHLIYTHGYGAVMNPVDEVTADGLPVFYLKDIPPSSPYFTLEEPRIYYGEETGNYVVTGTTTEEFDYPAGDQNAYHVYDGQGGVGMDNFVKRLIYGLKFGSVELLVSGSLTDQSKILFHRNIADRAQTIAPFLSYDSDPYVVVADDRLYWIIDAYTTADRFPYAEPFVVSTVGGQRLNYIRNSVKVVVDAYNGDITYYVVDPEDPLIKTYENIFPGFFKEFAEMPDSLKSHVRYPQGLFQVQADLYATYHMKDPRVFYNKEDAWVIPDEIYRGSRQQMQPYYVIMDLPGEQSEEFILMLPFTPRNKENMIGWMAARSDGAAYGSLVVYQFSKQELTYGPMQIEARIDQDTEISQDITLWSQSGSSVLRGNTLVIPIEDSIIYVEPLYLEATEKGTLPQLKRVIVAYGDRLTMQDTLGEALSVIFGGEAGVPEDIGDGTPGELPPISEDDREKLARIAELYDLAAQALSDGDLGLYQDYFDEIGRIVAP